MVKRQFCDVCKKSFMHSVYLQLIRSAPKVGYFCTYCGSFKRSDSFQLGKEKDRLAEQGKIVEKLMNGQKEQAEAKRQLASLGVKI